MIDASTTKVSSNVPKESEATQASPTSVAATAKTSSPAQADPSGNQVITNTAKLKLQEAFLPVNSHLQFEVDAQRHTVTVKVINDQSGEVFQIGPKELMGLPASLETGEGVLVNKLI